MRQFVPSHNFLKLVNLLVAFLVCISAASFALHRLNDPLFGIDDANIYFVYARNLADGHGFVYNVGGERVEGFTSLLWTLISAVVFKFAAFPERILLMINIALVSLGITYALAYIQRTFQKEGDSWWRGILWSGVFLIILFSSPRYVVWNTITLMENALWSTLLLLTVIFVIREDVTSPTIHRSLSPLLTLLLLTRPEAIFWVAVFLIVLLIRLGHTEGVISSFKKLAPSILAACLVLILLTVFRVQYFGYPLPNTYYAKVSPSFLYNLEQGALYLIKYIISDPIVWICIVSILGACLFSFFRPTPGTGAFFLPGIAAAGLLAPMLTGGDHFGSFRFYQNVYPIIVLCLLYVIDKAILPKIIGHWIRAENWSYPRLWIFLGLAFLLVFGFGVSQRRAWSLFVGEIKTEFVLAERGRAKGAFLHDQFQSLPHLPSVGIIAAGGIKYTYDGEVMDLAGLNNTMMAHNHGDRVGYKGHAAFETQTFFKLQPEILLPIIVNESWRYSEAELHNRWENTLALRGLYDNSQFLDLYKYAKVCNNAPSDCEIALAGWFRKDFLELLKLRGDFLIQEYEYSP